MRIYTEYNQDLTQLEILAISKQGKYLSAALKEFTHSTVNDLLGRLNKALVEEDVLLEIANG